MMFLPDRCDIPQLTELWKLLFDDDETDFIEMFMQKYFKKGNAVACKTDNKIIGVIYFFWGKTNASGKAVKTAFMYAGGIHPDYRHRGYMRKLVNFAFEYSREQGCEVNFGVSALYCTRLYETEGMKRCSELDVIDIGPEDFEKSEMTAVHMEKSEFIKSRNEYLMGMKKALIWDDETADFIYEDLVFSGEVIRLELDNKVYYATVSIEEEYVLIRETSLPLNMLCRGIAAIAEHFGTNIPFRIYRETSPENHELFEQTETMYYGHGILLKGDFDFDKCYINLIAE